MVRVSPCWRLCVATAVLCLAACAQPLSDKKSRQSGSLGIDASGKLWVALSDNGGVAVVDPAAKSGRLAFIPTGSRPEQLIVRGGSVYVSNRQSRTVSQIEVASQKITRTFETGAEPFGIDTSDDGATLFVANATSGTLQAFDTGSGQESWKTELNDEVHAIAALPNGHVYAPSFSHGILHDLDAASGKEANQVSIVEDTHIVASRQKTGIDTIVIAHEAGRVYLPHSSAADETLSNVGTGYYALPAGAMGSLTPVSLSFTTIAFATNTVLHFSDPDQKFPPPYVVPIGDKSMVGPRAAALAPAGQQIYVVNQLSNTVAVFSTSRDGAKPAQGLLAVLNVGSGPTGIALSNDDTAAYVYNAFDHSISVIRSKNNELVVTGTITDIAEQTLTPSQQNGRTLFHAAHDPRLSNQSSGGLACASCHPEGRQDGHTWHLAEGLRNTPALVGRHLERTGPYDRDGQMATNHDFGRVITERMGGSGITTSDLDDIFSWLESEPGADNPNKTGTTLSGDAKTGRVIFLTKAGCSLCHSGSDFTDNLASEVGTSFTSIALEGTGSAHSWLPKTPTLLGVFATPPYLHDGSAASLEDVLRLNGTGLHGVTAGLTETERKQLLAYLATL